MVLIRLPSGANVISQGAMPGPSDCMFLLNSGSVDIVITGGGTQGAKDEVRVVSPGCNAVMRATDPQRVLMLSTQQ